MRDRLVSHFDGQNGPVNVPVKIRFDKTYQFAAGSANVFITRFAERFKNSEGRLTSDIDTITDSRKIASQIINH